MYGDEAMKGVDGLGVHDPWESIGGDGKLTQKRIWEALRLLK